MKRSSLVCGILAAGLIAISAETEARWVFPLFSRFKASFQAKADKDGASVVRRIAKPDAPIVKTVRTPFHSSKRRKLRTQSLGDQRRTPKLRFRERCME